MSPKKSELSILPDIEKKLEQYATNLENFSIYEYERCQIHWQREPNVLELLNFEESPLCSTLKVQRDPFTGEIIDFHEVPLKAAGATAQNSMLFNRAPLPPSESTRGSASFIPFLPGSFPSDSLNIPKYKELPTSELLTIPPGFTRGLTFDSDGETVLKEEDIGGTSRKIPEEKHVINLLEYTQNEQNLLGVWGTPKKEPKDDPEKHIEQPYSEEEAVLTTETPVLNISKAVPFDKSKETKWAILLDASKPVKDFHEKVPNMARKYPFKLDPFQQLAILQLEQHNHVFVAAHTSAGKTVVAEYAIALSQRHKTRTIYTSPIKALSNQKYRDFKQEFEDVGLITGDFQINQNARCLIMTTEILRSMLYCGSDIIRDLDFVIFDEVHYINDRERGYVWEQVLIMLPKRVCLVLLSATVSKPEEFANWLGIIHERKVYVITTPRRPVPLQHYLYTGTDGKTKNNRFKILDSSSQWCMEGYIQAKHSIPEEKDRRGGERRQFTDKQDKTLWSALLNHLKTESLLPVVAFTFSRARCERNADNLQSAVLTTGEEKSKIHHFFEECIKKLKDPDKNLPQVQAMGESLKRGIGIHHSGLLPIIKETVEMLFQVGLIKILFATETFAMGVNMPARTVIFDSITKHDGEQWRALEPAEYIQMAGRAGRRGEDSEGNVIILCKNQQFPETTLKQMMMGRPQSLKSQFRLTYGMVLSLLRVESLSAENVMSRSFMEADHQEKVVEWRKDLKEVEEEIAKLCNSERSNYLFPLEKYFKKANDYFKYRKERKLGDIFAHPKVQKVMTPGRVLLICHKNHMNKLAMLLSNRKPQQYKVLILTDKNVQNCKLDEKTDLWYKMISSASDEIYCPTDSVCHDVVDIGPLDVLEITSEVIKVDTELVFKDWNNRQLLRFKNDPPSQTTLKAIQELYRLSLSAKNSDNEITYLHFLRDIHVDQSDLFEKLTGMYNLKNYMKDNLSGTKIPNFVEQFSIVFSKMYLEEKRYDLEYKLSKSSLTLYPEYGKMIQLLEELNYIKNVDANKVVDLKGRVACEIGMNELLITELVLRNVLRELKPAEVAALLSTLVFQVKSRNREEVENELLKQVTPALRKAIEELKKIHMEILKLEGQLAIRSDIQEELNLGVVLVVYEWASNKSFEEIMKHANYQEGIIVRCIQQLNDTICDVRKAAGKVIGDPNLKNKMDEASNAIKRDIVFAASLYTEDKLMKTFENLKRYLSKKKSLKSDLEPSESNSG